MFTFITAGGIYCSFSSSEASKRAGYAGKAAVYRVRSRPARAGIGGWGRGPGYARADGPSPTPELHLQPHPEARYELVDEVLAVTKRANVTKMGFVGNDAYLSW